MGAPRLRNNIGRQPVPETFEAIEAELRNIYRILGIHNLNGVCLTGDVFGCSDGTTGTGEGSGSGSGDGITELTGDVTATGPGSVPATIANDAITTAKILDDAVTYAKLQNVSATARILARKTAGAGNVEEATLTEVLDLVGSAAQGDILYRDAAAWARLGAGTSGQVLKTNGAAANPAWTNPIGGAGLAGESIYAGAGHPQGTQSASVGSFYRDTGTGRIYQKMGGGSTAYGWYLTHPYGSASALYGKPIYFAMPLDGAGLVTTLGGQRGWASQTGSGANNQLRVYADNTVYFTWDTLNVNGSNGSLSGASGAWRGWEYDFDFVFHIRIGASVADVRFWVGLSTAGVSDVDTIGSGANGAIMFRFSTTVPDTGWVGYSSNAAGNSVTAQVNAIAANTGYRLRIRFVRSGTPTIYYSVNDGTEISKTTNVPATAINSFYLIGMTAKAAAVKTMGYSEINGVWGAN